MGWKPRIDFLVGPADIHVVRTTGTGGQTIYLICFCFHGQLWQQPASLVPFWSPYPILLFSRFLPFWMTMTMTMIATTTTTMNQNKKKKRKRTGMRLSTSWKSSPALVLLLVVAVQHFICKSTFTNIQAVDAASVVANKKVLPQSKGMKVKDFSSAASTSNDSDNDTRQEKGTKSSLSLEPIELTSQNFASTITTTEVWLG